MKFLKPTIRGAVVTSLTLGVAAGAGAITTSMVELDLVDTLVGPAGEHCEDAIAGGDFEEIFICGDEFFEFSFNAVDGGGANVGDGSRYTRVPRADLDGPGEWASHTPSRPTGPNAAGCVSCHVSPVGTSAGPNVMNVIRDPFHTGDPSMFIQRNTPHLMGTGALQLLAEEISVELQGIRDQVGIDADAADTDITRDLDSKGVNYGTVTGHADGSVTVNNEGIDSDLLVKPFQWKGSDISLRAFTLGAMNGEIGMQPTETTGDGVDGDGDGVVNEASVEDITSTVIYIAGQTRPHTELELNRLRKALNKSGRKGRNLAIELGLPILTADDKASIKAGEDVFDSIGCASCHVKEMLLDNTVFSEPSANPDYAVDATNAGLGPEDAVTFDLTTDMLDNHIETPNFFANLANLKTNGAGQGKVQLFSDLKRHYMGEGLAESIDEVSTGAAVWMTKELWGIGQTGQYMHDGRSTTIPEAILEHGGEAQASRDAFAAAPLEDQANLTRFLQNLVILKAPEEE